MPALAPIAALATIVQPAAEPVAPPLGQPLRHLTTETRDDGKRVRRFVAERTIVFARDGAGFAATVTLDRIDAQGTRDEVRNFRAGLAGLVGLAIVMRLDAAGRVTAIDDIDAVWRAWSTGMANIPGPGIANAPPPLAALPAARRLAMFGSVVARLFASAEDRAPSPPRPTTLSAALPTGASVPIEAVQTRTRTGDAVVVALDGRGSAVVDGQSATIAISGRRTIDPGTALVKRASETRTTTLAGPAKATLRAVTIVELTAR